MIKIVGISGSRVADGNMDALLQHALDGIDQEDVQTEFIPLAGKKIEGCTHCNWCVSKQAEGEFCVQKDDMNLIYPKLLEADGIVLASPAHFGRLSGHLADMIDRTRVFVHGNVYKRALKNKVGGAIAIAFFRGGGVESTLASIHPLFFSQRMIVATSGMYQLGAAALTTREGKGRFEKDIRHIVLEDDYGTASAKALMQRIVELARIVKAGTNVLQRG